MDQSKRFGRALRGLDGMIVWVHEFGEDARKAGVSRQHLQDTVVIKLLDSGIRALGIGNVPEPPGNPWLNIFVATASSHDLVFYAVTVRLDEIVWLDRNRSFKTIATTWEVNASAAVVKADLPRNTEKTIDELVDYFVYDYQTANPRR
ncbi:MAG: hypothetical protein HY914_21760 [Desulfomonile tiedjei]|nr:hypothetical protein [Desulfomonile tiedjei]